MKLWYECESCGNRLKLEETGTRTGLFPHCPKCSKHADMLPDKPEPENYPRCPDCGRIMGVSKSCVCGYFLQAEKVIGGLCWHTGCSNKVPHGTQYCPAHEPKETLVNEQEAREEMRSELSRMVDLTTACKPKDYVEMDQRLWLAFHAGERYARAQDEVQYGPRKENS